MPDTVMIIVIGTAAKLSCALSTFSPSLIYVEGYKASADLFGSVATASNDPDTETGTRRSVGVYGWATLAIASEWRPLDKLNVIAIGAAAGPVATGSASYPA